MVGKAKPLYWDTCIFLAWIKQETCWPLEVGEGIKQTVEEWQNGKLVIVTSSITMLEVLSAQLTIQQKDDFEKLFSHPRLQLYDVNRRVAGKASVIRQHYDDRIFNLDGTVKSGRVIGMGDSIHLATALYIGVSEFQTLDGSGKKKRKFDLLALDGNVAGARLKIQMPKFVPPPVCNAIPIPPVAGQQADLFEHIELQSVSDLHSERLKMLAILKLAITGQSFINTESLDEVTTQTHQRPS